ncbi:MAG: hypothetical protein Q8P20_08755 [bacterium]|nr:hypothetical protein [bacterium]
MISDGRLNLDLLIILHSWGVKKLKQSVYSYYFNHIKKISDMKVSERIFREFFKKMEEIGAVFKSEYVISKGTQTAMYSINLNKVDEILLKQYTMQRIICYLHNHKKVDIFGSPLYGDLYSPKSVTQWQIERGIK